MSPSTCKDEKVNFQMNQRFLYIIPNKTNSSMKEKKCKVIDMKVDVSMQLEIWFDFGPGVTMTDDSHYH
ncbi:hypothetical protein ACTXT7_007478 [Hymenolepis weldensis]